MYILCLHADKAKGLQINLSEALQGKKLNYKAYLSYLLFAWVFLVICCCTVRLFHYLLTLCPLSPESKQMNAVSFSYVAGRQRLF